MLVLEGVESGYGESLVLRGVSLSVPPGRVVCLMGRNGVGKSTLVKTVMGELRCRRGRVLWNERDLTGLRPHQRAALGIGYVPQGRGIFPFLTVEENVMVGLEGRGIPRRDWPGLVEAALGLFPYLLSIRDRKAGALSGGQQQQLAIARALAGLPELLLLDEPTEGIQPSIIDEIGELVQALKRRGMAVLLVEQRVDFAQEVADEFVMLDQGAVSFSGSAHELTEDLILEYLSA